MLRLILKSILCLVHAVARFLPALKLGNARSCFVALFSATLLWAAYVSLTLIYKTPRPSDVEPVLVLALSLVVWVLGFGAALELIEDRPYFKGRGINR